MICILLDKTLSLYDLSGIDLLPGDSFAGLEYADGIVSFGEDTAKM